MAIIKKILDKTPLWGKDCFLAENSVLVGDVILGDECSVWFGAVIRGDVNFIKIGNRVNIQDHAIIHCTYNKYSTTIGNNVSLGHRAIVHGCTIKSQVLVGMGSIVMDDVLVESNSIIAAGAVVTQGKHIKSGEIWAGVPAKKIGEVSTELKDNEINRIAANYVEYSSWYK
ncbi:gamma carbonic anhydrase family protein [Apibacter muscae]|uniref:Gamma carbonic anhydrase family protein n=1 Tax=Apibacter muscae TaxID=2509004 RepID=A0A563D982_9FLAO|nr:gamma carbonic anhydrase family protein [Apibacter muscae]TWP26766.1 gamma carbonic anhydrase family protein [Apibacter muscae]TWP27603.1 gamma carbonic anhydrase family protein [Apibacter muscae]